MTEETKQDNRIVVDQQNITAYSLADLLVAFEAASKAGFELDINKNEGYPENYGGTYVLEVYKKEGQRGRPKKGE